MDMWVGHAMRRRTCIVCTVQIQPGDRVMIGQWKRTGGYGTRTTRTMSHLQCWVTKAEVWLDDHPYEPVIKAGPGRPQKYTSEQIRVRRNLLSSMKRWHTRQTEFIGDGMWATADRYKDKISVARDELNSM